MKRLGFSALLYSLLFLQRVCYIVIILGRLLEEALVLVVQCGSVTVVDGLIYSEAGYVQFTF